jgi:hypothetical protein
MGQLNQEQYVAGSTLNINVPSGQISCEDTACASSSEYGVLAAILLHSQQINVATEENAKPRDLTHKSSLGPGD